MLSSPNADDIKAIVSWNDSDNGQTFIVKNSQLFSQRIIPKYFDCTLSSFKRQLNYYGFVRVTDDDVNNIVKKGKKKSRAMKYRHERGKFQQNHPEMLYEIRRSTCNDPKIELDYLRDKVNSLEDECSDLRKELTDVKTQMQSWIEIMQRQQQQQQLNPSTSLNGVSPLPHQRRAASITFELNSLPLPRSKSMGVGCATVRMKSTESTSGMAAKEQDWELFQDAMFTEGCQGSLRKPSAERTLSNPGLLDALLNTGGKLDQGGFGDGQSDNDDSSYDETVPV